MLGGRVKTLHPRIHAGILARRERRDDLTALAEHGIEPFDLVCVNLYPFEQVARRARCARGGGGRDDRHRRAVDAARRGEELRPRRARLPARRLRARARRAARVAASSRSRRGAGSRRRRSRRRPPTRRRSRRGSPSARRFPTSSCPCSRSSSTSPTARTRTRAPPTTPSAACARTCSPAVEQLHGRELSFNNLNDLERGAAARARVHAAGVRDRQAREPVRRRRRRDDRGGVRASRSPPTRSRPTAVSSS